MYPANFGLDVKEQIVDPVIEELNQKLDQMLRAAVHIEDAVTRAYTLGNTPSMLVLNPYWSEFIVIAGMDVIHSESVPATEGIVLVINRRTNRIDKHPFDIPVLESSAQEREADGKAD